MKKLLLATLMTILLVGMAFGQSPSLDQHNGYIWTDSIAAIAGQTTDTSSAIYVQPYAYFDAIVFVDSIGTGASSSVTLYFDIAMTSTGPWVLVDSMSMDSSLTTLRANTDQRVKDLDGSLSDGAWARIRTTQHNGENDSSVVSTRLKMVE